jgi:uncharacterized protein YjbJ (UPF0337 family)
MITDFLQVWVGSENETALAVDAASLPGKIQERCAITKEETERQIHEWRSKL